MADQSSEKKVKKVDSSSKTEEKKKREVFPPPTAEEPATARTTLKAMKSITVKWIGGDGHLTAKFPAPLHGRPTPYVATP